MSASPAVDVPGLRRVTDADAERLTTLIAGAYAEHPGCVLDLPGVDDDLPAPATTAARRGSPWWVIERDGEVVASVGAGPRVDDSVELKRLYVAPAARGRGLATHLVELVERQAAGLGAEEVELWSDTRFLDAHRLYTRLGYERTGRTRELHDPSETTEFEFVRRITPATPTATARWRGPGGATTATLTALPDGWSLTSDIPGDGGTISIEADAAWRTCRAEVTTVASTRRLTADGAGRWWRDGDRAPELDGCEDVDVEDAPLTNTLPIRRLLHAGRTQDDTRAAWIRVPGRAIEPLDQRYTHLGGDRWRYASATGYETELTVDDHGLVVMYGDRWHRQRPTR
ncbi:MAG: putative glycolipid-binding domain-containing protein [Nitriliruptor sp.]